MTTDSNESEQVQSDEVRCFWQQVSNQVPASNESSEEHFEQTCAAAILEDVILNKAHENEHHDDGGNECLV